LESHDQANDAKLKERIRELGNPYAWLSIIDEEGDERETQPDEPLRTPDD